MIQVDTIQILSNYGTSITQQIKSNLSATGTNASGQTSNSLKFTVEHKGTTDVLRITGRKYFMTVETGRKPTPQYEKPSFDFVKRIREWLASRGKDMGAAYAIAKNIHKKGTRLFRAGGRKDIVSNVINQGMFERIERDLFKEFGQRYILGLKQLYDNGNK